MWKEYNLVYIQSLWHGLPKPLPNKPIYQITSTKTKYTTLGHGQLAHQTIYQQITTASAIEQVYILISLYWLYNMNSWYHLDALKSIPQGANYYHAITLRCHLLQVLRHRTTL